MSRTGEEPKPAWSVVPEAVRRLTAETLGSPVRRAMRVWGGYGPTPTYRLRLADGRRAFFKGVWPRSDEFPRLAIAQEELVYRRIGHLIVPWAPAFYGSFHVDGWHVLLLEDLGPKSAPPWTPTLARTVTRAFADFHRTTLGIDLPAWLPSAAEHMAWDGQAWKRMLDAGKLNAIAAMAGDAAGDALRWLEAALPTLAEAGGVLTEAGKPHALLHMDLRSDNLRWRDGRLRMFDWPVACAGPTEYDIAAYAQGVTAEGGPEAADIMSWYAEGVPVRPEVLDAAVTALAGFFAERAPQPELPGLPRLRRFQRRQLQVTLPWAAQRLHLPEPLWVRRFSV